jgi:hypothetical protein
MQGLDGGSITDRNDTIHAYENERVTAPIGNHWSARKSESSQAKRLSGSRRRERMGSCHSRYAEIAALPRVESRIPSSPGETTPHAGDDALFTPWEPMTPGEGDGKLEMKRIAS